ncbi:hypothetical protein PTKIN_Ptkin15bG0105700 [Pterospermum kingtungense]
MEGFKVFQLIAILSTISVISVNGQISTACTASMISSFTPCLNFITGSTGSANVSSPNQGCCGSLKSLMTSSVDCACLLITANVPFQLPINRTLALTLPRACNIGGVPVQCKAAGTPLPAPGNIYSIQLKQTICINVKQFRENKILFMNFFGRSRSLSTSATTFISRISFESWR